MKMVIYELQKEYKVLLFGGGRQESEFLAKLASKYKKSYGERVTAGIPDAPSYFQHTAGLIFKFGGTDTDKDGIYDKEDACPEVAGLKGLKYAVLQEPTKGDTINEGIMKELTGCDLISGRALYQETVSFYPTFTVVSALNHFYNINTTDHGTWRRQQVIKFYSSFLDTNGKDYDANNELVEKSATEYPACDKARAHASRHGM